jgi:hypothetical protein
MKTTKLTLLSLLAGTVLLTSCGGGVSEELKKELSAFEAEWTKAGDAAGAFGATLASEDSAMAAMQPAGVPDSLKANATPEQLAAVDSLGTVCDGQKAKTEEIKVTFDGFKANWDKDSKDWADWKAKVEKGEVSEEDAKKALEDWKKKLADANASITEWQAALEGVKTECTSTCDAQKAAIAAIPAEPVKEEKGKKKK